MPALVSPGVSVSVIDESIYAPTAVATVPLVFVATAENKLTPAGDAVAAGTLKANANSLYLISSQRELTSTFGSPQFYSDSNGTPLHGYEINEYGLMAAYSALGVSNRVYIVRADVDLSQLEGTDVRPTTAPANGTVWFDTTDTSWGIFEWDASLKTFSAVDMLVLAESDMDGSVPADLIPKAEIGQIGQYAVYPGFANTVFYKNYLGNWVTVGNNTSSFIPAADNNHSWQMSFPVVQGSATNPTLILGSDLTINDTLVTLSSGTTVDALVSDINTAALAGVQAYNNNGRFEIYIDDTSGSDTSSTEGVLTLDAGTINTAELADALGLTWDGSSTLVLYPPAVQFSSHVSVPAWKSTDSAPRPTGSVWYKTTTPNSGANFVFKIYNSTTGVWSDLAAPLYADDPTAIAALDPVGGGKNIAEGSMYGRYKIFSDDTARTLFYTRISSGELSVTGSVPTIAFTPGETFTVEVTEIGSSAWTSPVTVTMTGATAATFVADLLGEGISGVDAVVESSGAITIKHTYGGDIRLANVTGTPVTDAGFSSSTTKVRLQSETGQLILSNWVAATYTVSAEAPTIKPDDGTYWYWSSVDDVDIMIHDGTAWRGYQNETNDARGYNLSSTNPNGPMVAAAAPETQDDGSALVDGDLWVDTSDLENFPVLYRYESSEWVLIDNADQTTESGILFADARWDTDGTSDVVTDDMPLITDLLVSDYLDLDAPDPALYPRGTLLWNTRRSGYNVKKFESNYFNATDYPDDTLPTVKDTWVNASGNRNDGSPYMGRKAARVIITGAIQSAIDTNTQIREEQNQYTLITAPSYPEVVSNMVALNNDVRNVAFVIADTPFRLAANGTAIQNWSAGSEDDSITTADAYLGVFYPAGVTNNPFTTGNTEILVPPSHMALRVIIRNDDVAFPWFAPAGTRRGVVDNATKIGYIDSTTGELQLVGVTESLRDTLYENNINPTTILPGVGLVVYGQKTRYGQSSALDRINVARLVCYIRGRLQQIVKPFLFEPNDKITRDEVKQVVQSLMNDLVAKRGLYDYLVVCDETNNTPDRIDRNELYVDVAIEPVKAIEFIYIPVRILNTGAIASS